jgi:small subunit ribosomal protein S14
MPKLSQKLRDERRARLIEKYAERRSEIRRKLKDASLPCRITGRSRAVYRKFGISRIAMRDLGLRGELPGLRKSSW